jgi:sulfatase maturation enzyme AslB (radical SAM superfamily)
MFHGGEPFLAPVADLYRVHEGLLKIFSTAKFAAQTNLVYELTEEKRSFMKSVLLKHGFGTSWDYDIRFESNGKGSDLQRKHLDLWENNVRSLVEDGHCLTMIVSITRRLIEEKEPLEIINYAHKLGFKHILFERITSDGNAKMNSDIIPSNAQQDQWLHKMFHQTIELQTYNYIGNMLLAEPAKAYVNHLHVGNRCRTCDQSLLIIKADGTIAGCPNTGPVAFWGNIDWDIKASFLSEKRLRTISCEIGENPLCYTCPACTSRNN